MAATGIHDVCPDCIACFLSALFCSHPVAHRLPLSRKVLAGLLLGALFGLALQLGWGADDAGVQQTLEWVNIVGGGYVSLLKVVMMPLVFTSILSAINKLEQAQSLGKISAVLIGSMLTLVMIAGVVGMTITHLSGLTAAGLLSHG